MAASPTAACFTARLPVVTCDYTHDRPLNKFAHTDVTMMPPQLFTSIADWLNLQADWRSQPGFWVFGSLLLGVVVANMWWLVVRRDKTGRLRNAMESSPGVTVTWIARLLWLVLPGYATLLLGIISPRLMGLAQLDGGAPLGYGLAFTLLAWVILVAAGITYRHSTSTPRPVPSFGAVVAGSVRHLVEAGALQWHWAFYRAAAISAVLAVGIREPVTAGTWLGAAIVLLEGALNPFVWHDLRTPGRAERRILRAGLLVASSLLFLISRNFWLTWALHALPAMVLEPRLSPGPQPQDLWTTPGEPKDPGNEKG